MEKDEIIIFFENNKELVRQSKLHELGEILHTSESVLSRKIMRYYGCNFSELKEKFRQHIENEKTEYCISELMNFFDKYKHILNIVSANIYEINTVSVVGKNLTVPTFEYLIAVMNEENIQIKINQNEKDIVEFNFNKINQHKIIVTLNKEKIIIESRYKLMLYFSYAVTYIMRK